MRGALIAAGLVVLALVGPSVARASEQFGDLDVSFQSLKVNEHGVALVTYRTISGAVRHVYVWGAINANAPDPGSAQVRFSYDYTGGLKRDGRQTWRTFPTTAVPTTGRSWSGS